MDIWQRLKKHGLTSVFIALLVTNALFIFIERDERQDMQVQADERHLSIQQELLKMPERILNRWKAYLFEQKMRAMNIEKDTTGLIININR